MEFVPSVPNQIYAPILVANGDQGENTVANISSQGGDTELGFGLASNPALEQPHVGGQFKERSFLGRALVQSSIIALYLLLPDVARAREGDLRIGTATTLVRIGSAPCTASNKIQLPPSLNDPQVACDRPLGLQKQLADSSGSSKGSLNKRRPSGRAGKAGQPTDKLPREPSAMKRLPVVGSTDNAIWQASQLGVERIAIPISRPSSVSQNYDALQFPARVLRAVTNAAFFQKPEMRWAVLAAPSVILTIFACRLWKKLRAARKRIRSEKEIYNAVAEMGHEGRDLQAGVAAILKRIEGAFSLCNTFIVLLEPVTLEVHDTYSSRDDLPIPTQLIDEAISEIRKLSDEQSDLTLWHHPGSRGAIRGKLDKDAPDAVTSIAWLGNRVGAMLIARCQPGLYVRSRDTPSLQSFTQLLAILIDGCARPAAASSVPAAMIGATGEEVTGRIAHEFNNILVPIMGYAEMAADALNRGTSSRAYVERIQSAGERAKQMVEQMLNVSRKKEAFGSFDIAAATAEILPDLQMSLPASMELRAIVPDGELLVHGNATALQQVVINLCKNAREALNDGGTITVSVSVIEQRFSRAMTHGRLTSGSYVRVSVADTGPGISNMKRIFDPFFTTKVGEGGTGLGLAIVFRVVRRMNGQLNVRSSPGSGTQFDLFFPCLSRLKPQIPSWPIITPEYPSWIN